MPSQVSKFEAFSFLFDTLKVESAKEHGKEGTEAYYDIEYQLGYAPLHPTGPLWK